MCAVVSATHGPSRRAMRVRDVYLPADLMLVRARRARCHRSGHCAREFRVRPCSEPDAGALV